MKEKPTRLFQLSLLAFFIHITLCANSQISLRGKVLDGETELPISGAFVRLGSRSVKTDHTGMFSLNAAEDGLLKAGKATYYDYRIALPDIVDRSNTVIHLTKKSKSTGLGIAEDALSVYEPEYDFIFDFHFIDNLLFVGGYMNKSVNKRKKDQGYLNCTLTLFENGVPLFREVVPDHCIRLRATPFGQLILEGKDFAYLVTGNSEGLELVEIEFENYLGAYLPYTVSFDTIDYRVKIVPHLPQVVHLQESQELDENRVVRVVRNQNYFDRVNSDYSMLTNEQLKQAGDLGFEHGFNPKLYAPFLRSKEISIDRRTPYSPAYKANGEVIIFDALNQWIFRHSETGIPIDSAYAMLTLDGEEIRSILQDPITEKLYIIHEKKGVDYIRPINPYSGALGEATKIAYPFPKQVKVYNGRIYYIRHEVDPGFRHLYTQSLN